MSNPRHAVLLRGFGKRALHMIPVHSVEEGLEKARGLLKKPDASVTVIPDGVSVIVEEQGAAQ